MAKVLHFPLDQRPDRAGNLVIASALDAIESEITARHGKNLILRVAGNNWTTPPPGDLFSHGVGLTTAAPQ